MCTSAAYRYLTEEGRAPDNLMSNPFTKLYLEHEAISIMIQPPTLSSSMLVLCSRDMGLSGLGTALSRRDFGTSPRLLRPNSLTGPTSHRSSHPLTIGTAPRLPPPSPGTAP
ncbi:hypothetical protein VTO73DRAFT_2630 [Trametes versicolor]